MDQIKNSITEDITKLRLWFKVREKIMDQYQDKKLEARRTKRIQSPNVIALSFSPCVLLSGNKHLDNMANCPAKAAYGFMDLDTRTAK